ncbi:alpha/beta hydrolase [Dolichospermum sp. UHCC 0259]|uniref:alpha/beta hydrolase n=1 Tax=Dolichospermum sp. UHCC 0259 TaxID=2590010 RepID=UPI001445DC4D|nr:alpha/beta hydrolase [Dolichospermum sp. UHCC 0259]MTJ49601.1 alpha/beta fold hydrolase [Dolichospermum sp. UHCC 0259]
MNMFGNWGSTLKKNSLTLILSILLPTFGISNPVMAAEQIHASYSALEISIPITALESYAKYGIINADLAGYYQYIPKRKLQEFRKILVQPLRISPAVTAQFLDTQQGKFILQRLAELIKPKSHYSKFVSGSLRTALIAAAAEPEGLNLLNLLRKYPQDNINIDVASSLKVAGELEKMISDTETTISVLIQASKLEADQISYSNFSQLPKLSHSEILSTQKQTIKFFDVIRNRHLTTDIYIPNIQNPAPVIVISHGLGLDSSNFRYLAHHLVNHGFAVVIPNHPGSDAKQLKSLIKGNSNQVTQPNEFKDRPLDIKYILDQLESDSQFQQRLNLQQVGVFGQSLGGYTALALAGAKINFSQLQADCNAEKLRNTWNMSLLLQCRALELPNQSGQDYNLQDTRIKAAIAVNPITSSIFGQAGLSQIHTPVMIVGSSEDTVAPTLYEQIVPFSWIIHPEKYLVMLLGGTHFSTIGNSNPGSTQMALPTDMVGDASQAHDYMNALSLPFFQTYIAGKPEYLSYLNAAYAQSISSQSLGLNLVQSLDHLKLAPILGNLQDSKPVKKRLSHTIVHFGFWLLGIGISLLHLLAFF